MTVSGFKNSKSCSSSRLILFNEPCNMPLNMFIKGLAKFIKGLAKLQTNRLAYFNFRNQI